MTEPKLEVPAELRQLAEKTIDQAENAFGLFFNAARSCSIMSASDGTGGGGNILSISFRN